MHRTPPATKREGHLLPKAPKRPPTHLPVRQTN